ncbi:hypothetical protein Patl1_17937 [Pistacia atlantica]|uniref:Uncharacterized protein n=1 Tax=Pistacia atlantica TaxID=434234 RepID=A0ACC1BZB8_9ROSI|nr:hypothetical protein Patl1_17937 [Pistacia atlantica]
MDVLVGFRFHPTDEEIIRFLEKKRLDPDFSVHAITETNIYDFEPGELFGLSQIQSDGKWCSFFCAPDYVNAERDRVHRATKTGYWKITGTKTDWVMHQFSAKDNPLYKKDFVVCRVKRNGDKKRRNSTYVKGRQHKKLRTSTEVERQQHQNLPISIRNEGQVNHHLAFENTFLESQLPPNSNLISKFRNLVEENSSISESRNFGEDTSISDSRIRVEEYTSSESRDCVEENTSISRNRIEENTSPELQLLLQFLRKIVFFQLKKTLLPELELLSQLPASDYLISESRNRIFSAEENTSPELELLSQLPASDYLISEYRNRIFSAEENTSPELEFLSHLPANDYLISESRNHVVSAEENTTPELRLLPQFLPSNCMISEENTSQEFQLLPQYLPNNNLISNARNHAEGNISPEQLLPSNVLISNSRNQVIENTSPKSQLQSSNNLISNSANHIVENSLPVYSDLPTISNALEGNELDEASFSTLPSLINQEQGSSYSSFSISDCSPFGSEWEIIIMNPQFVIHDPCEGTGRSILPLYFNSPEAGGGFCGGDSSDINKWVNDISV